MTFVQNPEVSSLPYYTFRTLLRITLTLGISVAWGVSFGILAATNKTASVVLVPIIDLLQSIPILGYFPGVILFFISIFQRNEIGVELSAILLLFTSMAWAIFFGVVGAIKGIPTNITESAQSFGLTGSKYTRHVVLPAIVPALISGATLAWCDGWFFMIAAEYIQYQGNVVAPPSGGLGYLLAKAAYEFKDMNLAIILLLFQQAAWKPPARWIWLLIAANFVFVFALGIGDALIANAYRQITIDPIKPLLAQTRGSLSFAGHWGRCPATPRSRL
jgi:NitT/TauT family transport system permease protein